MKRDVDDILLKRFGVSGNISSYTLGTSGPIAAVGAAGASNQANAPAPTRQASRVQPAPPTPVPPLRQSQTYQPQPVGNYPPARQRQQGGSNVGRNFLLFVLVVFLIAVVAYVALNFVRSRPQPQPAVLGTPGATTPGNSATPPANGIGAFKAPDGETIGISDGNVAF